MRLFLHTANIVMVSLFSSFVAFAQIIITDDGSGTGTTTWTQDNIYILDGFVFVNDGDVLNIEPGTVIKGRSGSGADASALIVARGGVIHAIGTQESPIIFTFESDALDGSTPFNVRGQWGGVILLGSAQLNSSPGETQIEGIPDNESRGRYGGIDNMDSSGSISYVSIRHGGTDIGAGNEINGLTLGGVGAGTTLDYIEVISNADDGIEFFGGTASMKHVVTAFCGDDSFDYDEGWRGYGQFWCTVQEEGEGDRGGEHDGGTNPEDGLPYSHPIIYNATYLGQGSSSGKRSLTFRDNAGGEYHKSIFYNWGKGVDIENLASGEDSYERFLNNDIVLSDNIFDDCTEVGLEANASDLFKVTMGSGWTSNSDSIIAVETSTNAFQASFEANNNSVIASGLNYVIEEGSGLLDFVPNSDLYSNSESEIEWFDATTYPGAFDPADDCTWLSGWSMLYTRGFIDCTNSIDEELNSEFKIYPNPSNGNFSLTFDSNIDMATISVVDITGQGIYNNSINVVLNSRVNINLGHRTPGIYVMSISFGNQIYHSKLIIE